jgi:nicotinate-nucleotide adenylyltransferase
VRLGVFGGTFDPPHHGHLIAASDAFEALGLDRVFFVPNAAQPLKSVGPDASAPHRLEMTRLLCHGDARFEVDSVEIDRGGLSFTVETLRTYATTHSGAALFLLVGADVIPTMPAWREIAEVRQLAEVVVVTRSGSTSDGFETGGVRHIATRRVDISSTEIRQRAAKGLSLAGFVPPAVAAYIAGNGLYRRTT